MTKATQLQQRRKDGRYDLSKMHLLCVCGHTLGVHVAGGHNCIAHEAWNGGTPESVDMCDCEKFKRAKNQEGR